MVAHLLKRHISSVDLAAKQPNEADTGNPEILVTPTCVHMERQIITRSSADTDNRLDAFSGQSRSTNMVPFHMLHIVSLCNSNFVFKTF